MHCLYPDTPKTWNCCDGADGMDAYVTKPIHPEKLLQVIADAVDGTEAEELPPAVEVAVGSEASFDPEAMVGR